ncbi:pr5 [rat cytomegalovirus strain Maastricht]|uniref:Pr5 n=1 Tax=Rat cytomegalovirus (strain Maastricht) TaxID=79700 RepID=Q9DWH3_RCMVM|nr:pr5 [rat cytomegalovirus strain Maastricht]AAF99116.1 pr5 [rat cytomegalovirus strain Maastricht]
MRTAAGARSSDRPRCAFLALGVLFSCAAPRILGAPAYRYAGPAVSGSRPCSVDPEGGRWTARRERVHPAALLYGATLEAYVWDADTRPATLGLGCYAEIPERLADAPSNGSWAAVVSWRLLYAGDEFEELVSASDPRGRLGTGTSRSGWGEFCSQIGDRAPARDGLVRLRTALLLNPSIKDPRFVRVVSLTCAIKILPLSGPLFSLILGNFPLNQSAPRTPFPDFLDPTISAADYRPGSAPEDRYPDAYSRAAAGVVRFFVGVAVGAASFVAVAGLVMACALLGRYLYDRCRRRRYRRLRRRLQEEEERHGAAFPGGLWLLMERRGFGGGRQPRRGFPRAAANLAPALAVVNVAVAAFCAWPPAAAAVAVGRGYGDPTVPPRPAVAEEACPAPGASRPIPTDAAPPRRPAGPRGASSSTAPGTGRSASPPACWTATASCWTSPSSGPTSTATRTRTAGGTGRATAATSDGTAASSRTTSPARPCGSPATSRAPASGGSARGPTTWPASTAASCTTRRSSSTCRGAARPRDGSSPTPARSGRCPWSPPWPRPGSAAASTGRGIRGSSPSSSSRSSATGTDSSSGTWTGRPTGTASRSASRPARCTSTPRASASSGGGTPRAATWCRRSTP